MSIIQGNSIESGVSTYQIERSLRFNSADSAYLSRTPASAGNRNTWTLSFWHKRSKISDSAIQTIWGTSSNTDLIGFDTDDVFRVWFGTNTYNIETTQVFRDVSAWGHWLVSVDTTQATSSNRVKIYYNGAQVTAFSTASYPTQNYNTGTNNTVEHRIGKMPSGDYNYLNGYLTEVHFIDGQALDPTSFGEYNTDTGVWQPKAYTGSYGTNGFYLDFADNSSTTALGYDAAGSNDWTPNNFSVTAGAGNDSLVDTPTPYGTDTGAGGEVRGNYATLNPISTNGFSFTNGNLDCSVTGGTAKVAIGTVGVSSGKWYWEVVGTSGVNLMIGVSDASAAITSSSWTTANGWAYYLNGEKFNNNSGSAYGASYTTSDVIGVALDMDAGTLTFYKNGSSQGTAFSTGFSGKTIVPMIGNGSSSNSQVYTANFGQRPFAYTAPSGFKALCTQNLPEPTVVDGGDYFNTVLYTGNADFNSITTVGFQPDLVWVKERSEARDHILVDAVRTISKGLYSNLTSAEGSTSNFTEFLTNGFKVGYSGVDADKSNKLNQTYVAWNWKAGGTGVTNTAGTITSTVSANPTAGFSIVTYTGTGANATVGHGLGVAPSMVIVKSRASARDWPVYHKSTGNTQYAILNGTGAFSTASTFWNNTSPTSTVFSLGTALAVNASENYVAYCFAPIAGYSAFGSYTGNGSTDGPFVYTGFRPRYIMLKCSSTSGLRWNIFDTSRSPYNVGAQTLYADSSAAEDSGTGADYDILSNGFKLRSTNSNPNTSGATYIYAAFAENPFKYSLAR